MKAFQKYDGLMEKQSDNLGNLMLGVKSFVTNNVFKKLGKGLGDGISMCIRDSDNSALLTYAPKEVDLEEPSAGYIYTWDMLGNGQWMATSQYDGPGGSHSEFIEGLMATDMKKTSDDLATFLTGCVSK